MIQPLHGDTENIKKETSFTRYYRSVRRIQMTPLVRMLAGAALVQMLVVPALAIADDRIPSEKEIMQSEGMPPLIPHAMPAPDKNGRLTCLSCHEEGKNGAPPTPHPERRMCTQCHIQGEVKTPDKAGK